MRTSILQVLVRRQAITNPAVATKLAPTRLRLALGLQLAQFKRLRTAEPLQILQAHTGCLDEACNQELRRTEGEEFALADRGRLRLAN